MNLNLASLLPFQIAKFWLDRQRVEKCDWQFKLHDTKTSIKAP